MNLAQVIMGLGALMGGAKSLRDGLSDSGVSGPNIRQSPVRRANRVVQNIKADEMPAEMKTESHEVQSLDDRIKYIKQMVYKGREHPIIRKLTVQILSRKCGSAWCTPEKNHKAEIKAIFDAVRSKIRYVRDTYNKDLYQHPVRTLQFGGGDCDDYSIVLASMLQSVGYPVKLRVIRTKDSEDWNHIYVLVGLPPRQPTEWISLDGSVEKAAGWEAPKDIIAEVRDFSVE